MERVFSFFLFFLERWKLNEAVKFGLDGEWLQTQGNYFLAGEREGARAPSLTGCSLLMDRGDDHTYTCPVVHTSTAHAALCRFIKICSLLFNQSHIWFGISIES